MIQPKIFVILGVSLTLFGLILMIHSRKLKTKDGKTFDWSHTIQNPWANTLSWIFT